MVNIDISQLPKGAHPQPRDERDFLAQFVFGAPTVDWSKEFRLPEPPNENQGSSLSCVSQSWSYYHWQLHNKDYSRRSLYSRIFLPQGGAYLRDGGKEIVNRGHATRDEAPDPMPQTELEMRKRDGITEEEEASDKELEYYSLGNDPNIDLIAYAIANYKGCVFGVRGTNKSWQDYTNPKVPAPDDVDFWYHAIYGMGYHLHDGQKCVIAKSSWCNGTHKEHHIKQEYFNAGGVYNCWVLIPKGDNMNEIILLINYKGKVGLLFIGGFTGNVLFAKSIQHLRVLGELYGKPITVNSQGGIENIDINIP